MEYIDILNLLVSAIMLGVIWIIQIVHYPSFKWISKKEWTTFHSHHTLMISPIVAPVMLIELSLTIMIVYRLPNFWHTFSLFLLVIIWISTFFVQVPIHQRLGDRKNLNLIDRLVHTNWVRTISWTIKTLILLFGLTLK